MFTKELNKKAQIIIQNIKNFNKLIDEVECKEYIKPFYENIRRRYIKEVGWWVLSEKNINKLAKLFQNKKVLSIAAGLGYGEKWIEKKGDNIKFIITDIKKTKFFKYDQYPEWVEELDAVSAFDKYIDQVDAVFLAWPPYKSDIAYKILMKMPENKQLVVIGEGIDGCTANDDFWEEIEDNKKYKVNEIYDFDSFGGIIDYISIICKNSHSLRYKRKH